MKIDNLKIFGLEDSIKAAKYPKSININNLNSELTSGIAALAQAAPGSGHDQFLTGIIVQFDLTYSIKMAVELQRYHFIDFVSSQSTMHKISQMDIEMQCNKYVENQTILLLKRLIDEYNKYQTPENYLKILYNIPTGFELTSRFTTNYRQLKTIYKQRRNHRLPEWREFCKWLETLPHSEFIIGE